MRDGAKPLDFTFPDVDGKPVSLRDARFRGKVVLVTLGGTWCPNCRDEAQFLVPFYREYREDLGIEFPTLIAGLSETDEASKALPMLNAGYGYPTALLMDRSGVVRSIHTGFAGPATGRHYQEHVREFRDEVERLLARDADH